MSNVLVISTSLRARSNSDILTERLIAGAKDAGHTVEHISLKGKDILAGYVALLLILTAACIPAWGVAESEAEQMLVLSIDGIEIPVDWESNESVEALKTLVSERPLTVQMSMYGGFE